VLYDCGLTVNNNHTFVVKIGYNDTFTGAAFGQYLLEKNIVRSGTERFLVILVRKFFEDRHHWPQLQWFEQLPFILINLKEAENQQWPITQAEQAARGYFTNRD
jgi:hypothetical protein